MKSHRISFAALVALALLWGAVVGWAREVPVTTEIKQVYGRGSMPRGDWSPDGRWFVQPMRDGRLDIWDNWYGTLARSLSGHTARARQAVVAHDGTWFASIGDDKTLRRWDMSNGQELGRIDLDARPLSVDINASDTLLATATESGLVQIWSVTSNTLLTTVTQLALSPDIRWARVFFSPSSKLLNISHSMISPSSYYGYDFKSELVEWETGNKVVGMDDYNPFLFTDDDSHYLYNGAIFENQIQLWKAPDWTVRDYNTYIYNSAYSKASGKVAFDGITSIPGYLVRQFRTQIFAPPSTAASLTMLTPRNSPLEHMKFSADASMLLGAGTDGHLYTWELTSGTLIRDLQIANGRSACKLQYSPDGRYLACLFYGGNVVLWRTDDGSEIRRWSLPVPYDLESSSNAVASALRFSSNSRALATTYNNRGALYNIETGEKESDLLASLTGYTYIRDLDMTDSTDERSLLFFLTDDHLYVADQSTGGLYSRNIGGTHLRVIDNEHLILKRNGQIGIYDWLRDRWVTQFSLANDFISMDVSRNKALVLATCMNPPRGFTLFHLDTGATPVNYLESTEINLYDACLTPDATRFAQAKDTGGWDAEAAQWILSLRSVQTGEVLRYFQQPDLAYAAAVAISPDGHRVVFGGAEINEFELEPISNAAGWAAYE